MTRTRLYYHSHLQLGRVGLLLVYGLFSSLAWADGVPAFSELSVHSSWGSTAVTEGQVISLTFDQTLSDWGSVVLMVGDTDVTHLFKPIGADGLQGVWVNESSLLGEQTFKVMQATSPTQWHVAASWPMFIEPVMAVKAKGSVGVKGQPWSQWSGNATPFVRPTYTDATTQLSLGTDFQGDAYSAQSDWQFLGSSNRPEAVRFPIEQQQATKPDLVGYSIKAQRASTWGLSTITAGQVAMDVHPLLAPAYTNRGVVMAHAFDKQFDVSLGLQSASQVLGVKNMLGVEDDDSMFTSAKLGVELLPERAGGLRAELGWFNGQLKPSTLLNVAPSPQQMQHSQGWGIRLQGRTEDERLSGELNWASSRYQAVNTFNNQPEQTDTGAKQAHAWALSYQMLPPETMWQDLKVDVTISMREDRSPALFRSLGGGPSSDYLSRELGLNGTFGIVSWGFVTNMGEDNVEEDILLFQNLRRQQVWDFSLPLAQLPGMASLMKNNADIAWWPQLTYNQVNTQAWANPDFLPIGLSVDDLENVHTLERKLGLVWTKANWSIACQWLTMDQDNRQVLFEHQDMQSRGWQLDANWRLHPNVKLGFKGSQNQQRLLDSGDTNTGRNLGLHVQWAIQPHLQLNGTLNHQQTLDAFGPARKAIDTLQLSINGKTRLPDWAYWGRDSDRLQGLWFIRLAISSSKSQSDVSYLNYAALTRSLQLGFSIAF